MNHDMQQYLRLHALGDTFANTVQKASRFAASTEFPRTRKSVRITTPPAHEAVQMIKENSSLHQRLDKLEDMIQSLQATSRADTPPQKSSTVTCVGRQSQRQFPTSRTSGEARDNGRKSPQNRRQFIRPFNANVNEPRQTQTETNRSVSGSGLPSGRGNPNQNLVRAGVSGGSNVPPGVCWVCRQPRCHFRFHETNGQPSPQPRARTPDVCWTCGQQWCRTWYHSTPGPATPVPLMDQNSGNVSGTRRSGNRDPTQSARRVLN